MRFRHFIRTSAFAWGVTGLAVVSTVAIATQKTRVASTDLKVLKLVPSSGDKFERIKKRSKFNAVQLASHKATFLSAGALKAKLQANGLLPGGTDSITLTPTQPSQTISGGDPPTAFLTIVGGISLSPLTDPGWFQVESPDQSLQPVGLEVIFRPTAGKKPYMVEVDYTALYGTSNVVISQLDGPLASVPVSGTSHSAQIAVIPSDTNFVSLIIWPDKGNLAITAVKITGF